MRSFSLNLDLAGGVERLTACQDAQHIADTLQVDVRFRFNSVSCVAVPGGDAAKLSATICEQVVALHIEGRATSWVGGSGTDARVSADARPPAVVGGAGEPVVRAHQDDEIPGGAGLDAEGHQGEGLAREQGQG